MDSKNIIKIREKRKDLNKNVSGNATTTADTITRIIYHKEVTTRKKNAPEDYINVNTLSVKGITADRKEIVKKKKDVRERPIVLDMQELAQLIEDGNKEQAYAMIDLHTCKADEPCNRVIYRSGLCYNHYMMKSKYGRTKAAITRHTGEKCVESYCDRDATNLKWCHACYLRHRRAGNI